MLLQFLEYLTLGNLRIEGKQPVNEILHAVKALFGSGEIQQFFYSQHSCTVDDGLIGVVNEYVAVCCILLSEKYDVNAELGFQFLLQFFLVGTYITILFEDAPKLAVTCSVVVAFLIQCLNVAKRKFLLYLAAMFDKDGAVFLIDLVAHRSHYRFKLGKRGEGVLFGDIQILLHFLFPVIAKYAVYHFL